MASFAPIGSLDYAVNRRHDPPFQTSVLTSDFEYQHTSEFEFYKICHHDYSQANIFGKVYTTIRPELAGAIWEAVRMKARYIYAAANQWRGDTDYSNLPRTIPEEKLTEIDMLPPPIPPVDYLMENFLAYPETLSTLQLWIEKWQQTGHMLTAWIAKAKERCEKWEVTSWSWPDEPCMPEPYAERVGWDIEQQEDPQDWTVAEALGLATRVKIRRSHSTSSINSRRRYLDLDLDLDPDDLEVRAAANQARTQREMLKRHREDSDDESSEDSDAPSKRLRFYFGGPLATIVYVYATDKQLIKWQPPISAIFEMLSAAGSRQLPLEPDPDLTNYASTSTTCDPRIPRDYSPNDPDSDSIASTKKSADAEGKVYAASA
jgi:hypothetical protein